MASETYKDVLVWLQDQWNEANMRAAKYGVKFCGQIDARFIGSIPRETDTIGVQDATPELERPPSPTGNYCSKCGGPMRRDGMCEICMECGYAPGGCG